MTGTAFLEETKSLAHAEREDAIYAAIAEGAVPSFVHTFVEVHLVGFGQHAVVGVAVDYAAIGTDDDFVRIPMTPRTAQRLADLFGYLLPTCRIVDAAYDAAVLKLSPTPLAPGPHMMRNDYYRRHHEMIEAQRRGRCPNALVAGHKKDVVISKRLHARPDRVAIYGWHRPNRRPIQPLSLLHESTYADYSHGVRWVKQSMSLNGAKCSVVEVLRDPKAAGVISHEGVLLSARAAAPFV